MEANEALVKRNRKAALAAYVSVTELQSFDAERPDHLWAMCFSLVNMSYFYKPPDAESLVQKAERLLQVDLQNKGVSETAEKLKPYLLARKNITGEYWSLNPDDDILPAMNLDLSESDLEELFFLHEITFQRQTPLERQRTEQELVSRGVSPDYIRALEWMYGGG